MNATTTSPDLTGKVALVTGGSRGIGRQLAIAMARCGATVVISARNLDSSPGQGGTLRGTAEAIEAEGGAVIAIPASITTPEGAEALIAQTVAQAGRIDVLVNNAAIFPSEMIADTSPEDWEYAVAVNLNSVFYLTRYALPVMAGQGGGRIVNVSTDMVVRYRPGRVAYSATKAAVDLLSLGLAEETRAQNIEVNVWTPGHVRTDMAGPGAPDAVESVEESFMWMLAQPPLALTGRILRKIEFGETWGAGV